MLNIRFPMKIDSVFFPILKIVRMGYTMVYHFKIPYQNISNFPDHLKVAIPWYSISHSQTRLQDAAAGSHGDAASD